MKYCPDCQIEFEDGETICCYCGMPLKKRNENVMAVDNHNDLRNEQKAISSVNIFPNIQFIRSYGFFNRNVEINGVAESVHPVQYYQNKLTKFIRAVFSGEPYQFGHTTFENLIRINELMPEGYSKQAIDVVLYGNLQSVIAEGDDLRIEAVRKGNRLVAKRIYNNATNSYIHVQPNIHASFIRAIIALIVFSICILIKTLFSMIENVNSATNESNFFSNVFSWIIVIAIILWLLKYIKKNLFK